MCPPPHMQGTVPLTFCSLLLAISLCYSPWPPPAGNSLLDHAPSPWLPACTRNQAPIRRKQCLLTAFPKPPTACQWLCIQPMKRSGHCMHLTTCLHPLPTLYASGYAPCPMPTRRIDSSMHAFTHHAHIDDNSMQCTTISVYLHVSWAHCRINNK